MSRGRGRAVSDDDDEPVGMRRGRWTLPFTQVPDWVMLAQLRPPAKLLYWALASHLNMKDGTLVVNPTMAQVAEMLGYSRRDKLLPYFEELAEFGAIDIETELVPGRGNIKRNTYVVHQDPPESYDGPLSLGDFHRARKARKRAEAVAREEAAKAASVAAAKTADDPVIEGFPDLSEAPETGESAGHEPYPVSGTDAVPRFGYGSRTPFQERNNKTNKQDDWNKIGGRTAAPRTPAALTTGHVDKLVTLESELVGNQQTARADVHALTVDPTDSKNGLEAVVSEPEASWAQLPQSDDKRGSVGQWGGNAEVLYADEVCQVCDHETGGQPCECTWVARPKRRKERARSANRRQAVG